MCRPESGGLYWTFLEMREMRTKTQYRVYITKYQEGAYSNHYSMRAAILSQDKLNRSLKNGAYLPTVIQIRQPGENWQTVDHSER